MAARNRGEVVTGRERGKIGVNKGEKEERLVNHCASEKFPIKWMRRDFMNTFREGESLKELSDVI